MRLKVSTSLAYWEGTSELLPYNKVGLDHVEVGLGQRGGRSRLTALQH